MILIIITRLIGILCFLAIICMGYMMAMSGNDVGPVLFWAFLSLIAVPMLAEFAVVLAEDRQYSTIIRMGAMLLPVTPIFAMVILMHYRIGMR
jgi:hypothetical protein